METFQDGEFTMECRKYQQDTPQSRRASYLRFKAFLIIFLNETPAWDVEWFRPVVTST